MSDMDDTAKPALARIDRAIERIERAAATALTERDRLSGRHDELRGRIAEAITALDAVIERGEKG